MARLHNRCSKKYLPDPTAKVKWLMKKFIQGIQSTYLPWMKQYQKAVTNANDMFLHTNPQQESHNTNHIFYLTPLANCFHWTLYTDINGKFLIYSLDSMWYVFILYYYTTNAILVKPMADREVHKDFKPLFNMLYNESSKLTKDFVSNKFCW